MGEGFFSKMKVLIGVEEVDDDDSDVSQNAGSKLPNDLSKPLEPRNSFIQQKQESSRISQVPPSINKNQFKLMVIEPRSFDECPKLVDNLKNKKPIIINLERIDSEVARKIFDFLSGATYALDGNVQRVANNIFIFAPDNVDVTANIDTNKGFEVNEDSKSPWK
ncbi:MAG: cell division protein SepF [Eubacteriales bacterium]